MILTCIKRKGRECKDVKSFKNQIKSIPAVLQRIMIRGQIKRDHKVDV